MQRDPRAFLWDVREAAQAIQSFTAGLDVKGYVSNELVQAAVERKFEVIGEALNQLRSWTRQWLPAFRMCLRSWPFETS